MDRAVHKGETTGVWKGGAKRLKDVRQAAGSRMWLKLAFSLTLPTLSTQIFRLVRFEFQKTTSSRHNGVKALKSRTSPSE